MGLLDILAERMNYMYLSDLRYLPRTNTGLQCAVADLPFADFSEFEWIDAAEYLYGINCKSAEEARITIQERV